MTIRLYLAGPMSGVPEFNYPAFHEAANQLRDPDCDRKRR